MTGFACDLYTLRDTVILIYEKEFCYLFLYNQKTKNWFSNRSSNKTSGLNNKITWLAELVNVLRPYLNIFLIDQYMYYFEMINICVNQKKMQ